MKAYATDKRHWWEFKIQGGPQWCNGEGQLHGALCELGFREVKKIRGYKKHINEGMIQRERSALGL